MINLIPSQYRNQKTFIVFVALLLGCVAVIIFLVSTYNNMLVEFDEKEQQLFMSQKNVRKIKGLQAIVKQQQQQIVYLDRFLLKGGDQDIVISAMQIQVQTMLTASGLEPESLRPVTSRKMEGNAIQSVVLKLRLSGSLEQFKLFLVSIYKAESFFYVEGLTIKPFKQNQLKIYMDLRSYYHTSSPQTVKQRGGR